MKKRNILLTCGVLFFLLSIFAIFIIFNLDLIFNQSFVKQKIEQYFKNKYHISFFYKKTFINPGFKNFIIEISSAQILSDRFKGEIEKIKLKIPLNAILKLDFIPEKILLQNPVFILNSGRKKTSLLVTRSSGSTRKVEFKILNSEKDFWKKIAKYLQPFKKTLIEISQGKVVLKKENLSFKNIDALISIQGVQTLFEINAFSSFSSSIYIKGILNYQTRFSEITLKVRDIDLATFPVFFKKGLQFSDLNLNSEISIEESKISAGFNGNFIFYLKKDKKGIQIISCEKFEGIFLKTPDGFKVQISRIKLSNPELTIKLVFYKKNSLYYFNSTFSRFSLSKLNSLLKCKSLKKLEKVLNYIKAGNFTNFKIQAVALNPETLFQLQNMEIGTSVSGGEFVLKKPELKFSRIHGFFSIKGERLKFKGDALLKPGIQLKIQALSFKLTKPHEILLRTYFKGKAPVVKKKALSLCKSLSFLKKFRFRGKISGFLELKGPLHALKTEVKLHFKNNEVKLPSFFEKVFIIKGELFYKHPELKFEKFSLKMQNISLNELNCTYNTVTHKIKIFIKNTWIFKKALMKLLQKNAVLRKLFQDYDLKVEKVFIQKGHYTGIFDAKRGKLLNLEKKLYLKGILYNGSLILHFRKLPCRVKIKKVRFEWNKGALNLKKGKFKVNESLFNLQKGFYNGKIYLIKGKGELKKELAEALLKILVFKKKVKLRISPDLKDFYFLYKKGGNYLLNATVEAEKNHFTIFIKKTASYFQMDLNYCSTTENTFFFRYLKDRGNIYFKARGNFKPEKIAGLFLKNFSTDGEVILDLWISFEKKPEFTVSQFLRDYLQNRITIKGFLIAKNLVFKQKNLIVNYSGKIECKKGIKLKIDKFRVNGAGVDLFLTESNFSTAFKRKKLSVKGKLNAEFIDLSKLLNKKQKKSDWFGILKKFPLEIKISLNFYKVKIKKGYNIGLKNGAFLYRDGKAWLKFLKADFCNVIGKIYYKRDEKKQWFFIKVPETEGELLKLTACLYRGNLKRVSLEGSYHLKGFLYGEGKTDFTEKNFGTFSLSARNGYIYRAPLLARILAFLSPIDLFKGKIPRLGSEALQYDKFQIKSFIYNSRIMFNKIFLSASGFRLFGEGEYDIKKDRLNLTFYASPFKTIDVIVENIPFIGKKILGKEKMLIFFPLKVSGTRKKISIIPLHPISLGKGIKDFIFRLFGAEGKYFSQPKKYKFKIPAVEKKIQKEFNF